VRRGGIGVSWFASSRGSSLRTNGNVAAEALGADTRVAFADLERESLRGADAVFARLQRDGEVTVDGAGIRGDGEQRARPLGDDEVHAARVRAELVASRAVDGALEGDVAARALGPHVAREHVAHVDVAAHRGRLDVAFHVRDVQVAIDGADVDVAREPA